MLDKIIEHIEAILEHLKDHQAKQDTPPAPLAPVKTDDGVADDLNAAEEHGLEQG